PLHFFKNFYLSKLAPSPSKAKRQEGGLKLGCYNGDEIQAEANMLVKIETYFDGELWCARGLGDDIFTQGDTLDDLYRCS
ncbi:MAG: hypothetical protein COZ67_01085, partial [Chloroflexi bacterium CG_4_8_14_3_um_filter_45_15]